jgi:hypothetical protein
MKAILFFMLRQRAALMCRKHKQCTHIKKIVFHLHENGKWQGVIEVGQFVEMVWIDPFAAPAPATEVEGD